MSEVRILIAEDEFIIALELQCIVEEIGATVIGPAMTLNEALSLADKAGITAALLDLRLGKSSIDPVARRLSERGIPFLFYSGQPASDPMFAKWRDILFIPKPASSATIAESLRTLLSRTPAKRPGQRILRELPTPGASTRGS